MSAPRPRTRARPTGPVALTGTPGVGKSTVARLLAPRWRTVEVAELARRHHAAVGRGRALEVDLARLRRALRARTALVGIDLVVGHLAHLLGLRGAIVLRCHPRVLARRLERARRGTRAEREANVVSETVDLLLVEALESGVPVYEIDTTGRSPRSVAAEVERRLRSAGRPRAGIVDWLADRSVARELPRAPR